MSDLDNETNSNYFLFCGCGSQVLERISIKNISYYDCFSGNNGDIRTRSNAIPQNALIKFLRNAPPSLRWCRSNLTPENIAMLRLERPGLKLVN